ncbi:hypothetical protein DPMN_118146 [Dreissena polymorpha]|uniref:Uncharacterized protein n=1 Tax=Dreissena polymorpha TaxID=45954 RepID=A0A9D4GJM2_DREPO|nr:hypothetical protein DPMN_118146 [Dreissena polymorpha]
MERLDDELARVHPGKSVSLPCWSGTVRVGAVLIVYFTGTVRVGSGWSVLMPGCHRDEGLWKTVNARKSCYSADHPKLSRILIWWTPERSGTSESICAYMALGLYVDSKGDIVVIQKRVTTFVKVVIYRL